ncbi:hypothetical protein Avbf_05572 [Armadillidium vulgare]|nr:hypothetical protein Avbf_05572 [Armadillidium vulgare]
MGGDVGTFGGLGGTFIGLAVIGCISTGGKISADSPDIGTICIGSCGTISKSGLTVENSTVSPTGGRIGLGDCANGKIGLSLIWVFFWEQPSLLSQPIGFKGGNGGKTIGVTGSSNGRFVVDPAIDSTVSPTGGRIGLGDCANGKIGLSLIWVFFWEQPSLLSQPIGFKGGNGGTTIGVTGSSNGRFVVDPAIDSTVSPTGGRIGLGDCANGLIGLSLIWVFFWEQPSLLSQPIGFKGGNGGTTIGVTGSSKGRFVVDPAIGFPVVPYGHKHNGLLPIVLQSAFSPQYDS